MARPLPEDVHQYQDKIMCHTSLQDYLAKLLWGTSEYKKKSFVICLLLAQSSKTCIGQWVMDK